MKCINCGKEIEDGKFQCPECGAFQIDESKIGQITQEEEDGVPISTAIATVLVIIFITCAVIGFYFAYGRDKISENNIRKQLNNISGESLIEMYYDDFNGDGSKEAFAVTGSGSSNAVLDGTVWYIKDTTGINIKSDFSGKINGVLVNGNNKFFSFDAKNEAGEDVSFIFGVNKYSDLYQPEASEKYSGVHQENGKVFTGDGKIITLE